MKKTLKNSEITTIIKRIRSSAEQDEKSPDSAARLPFAVQWKKRLNFKELLRISEIISEEEQKIDSAYLDDGHSYQAKDASGNDIRRIKNSYIAEFSRKKAELYDAETDVEIRTVSPDELYGAMLTDLQMDAIAFMVEEDKDAGRS